jgi:demethylmenaquinone methyltransferase/2-methoxy-6-polyprenyl-1,4-benzoquinol methylase
LQKYTGLKLDDPDQETLKQMVLDAGFGICEYHNLSGGIVALHKGIKA